jgi:hypothetical protein
MVTVPYLVEKLPAFYGSRLFITAFKTAHQLKLPHSTLFQSTHSQHIFLRSTLILSFHLCLDIPSGLLRSGFPIKILCAPLFNSSFDHPNNIWWGIQFALLPVMRFPSVPCYVVHLRPKYLPQHPTLKHSQSVFFFHCKTPSFTRIKTGKIITHSPAYAILIILSSHLLLDLRRGSFRSNRSDSFKSRNVWETTITRFDPHTSW